jgi:hypothetical protein
MSRPHPAAALVAAVIVIALSVLVVPTVAGAQTLRGSHEKVERAYTYAKRRGIEFTTTRDEISEGVKEGEYV